jgi:hypothetical protein
VVFGIGYVWMDNKDIKLILRMTVVQNLCVQLSNYFNNEIATDPVLVFVITSMGIGEVLSLQH